MFALFNLTVWLGTGLVSAFAVTAARPSALPEWRELAGRPIEEVTATTSDGLLVQGWLIAASEPAAGPNDARIVVIAAGIGRTRAAMGDRACWYLENGWSVLMVDLRGTGTSTAARVSFGWHEALDLIAWRELLVTRGYRTIGAHGQSIGAAAVTYTALRAQPATPWSFVVLEACYLDFRAAISARTPILPSALSWPMIASSEWLLDVDADAMAPVDAVKLIAAPTMFVCGDADTMVGPNATEELFSASAATHKERFLVHGAEHVDLWPLGGDELRRQLGEFLQRVF